jgi:hypothetical protein
LRCLKEKKYTIEELWFADTNISSHKSMEPGLLTLYQIYSSMDIPGRKLAQIMVTYRVFDL